MFIFSLDHLSVSTFGKRNRSRLHLRASSLLGSTFGGDTQGSFSSGSCPQCSHFAQRTSSYDGLLGEKHFF